VRDNPQRDRIAPALVGSAAAGAGVGVAAPHRIQAGGQGQACAASGRRCHLAGGHIGL